MKHKIGMKLGLIGLVICIFFVVNYFILLPFNLRYTESFVLFLLFIAFLIVLFYPNLSEKRYTSYSGNLIETIVFKKEIFYVFIGMFVLFILYQLSSTPILFSKQYQQLIGTVEEKEFKEDIVELEENQLPIVDLAYAEKLGDKKLGADRGLGSEFHVGEFSDIIVNGKMLFVAPLEFNGFFKWMNNKTTPGYVTVDKITGEVELVTSLKGEDIQLKYVSSAYFNHQLKRHAYFHGNMDQAMVKETFELDEEGRPYFVLTKIHKTIGMSGGEDVLSVVLVDAQTGDVKEYKKEEVPSWVDTVYPEEIVLKQLDDWGYYVNGYFNTLFSEKDIIRITPDSKRVYNKESLSFYTGMTSNGVDESTVGFAFVDTRTKKTTFYKMIGATEQAAMKSAQGKVENYGYKASFPLPITILEEPTFFVTLKDKSGLIKQYAFVNIVDFSIVANGDTIVSAYQEYVRMLNKTEIETDQTKEVSGEINRIGFDLKDGIISYYFTLVGDKTLYYGNSNISPYLTLTKIGDNIKIKHNQGKLISFQNETLK